MDKILNFLKGISPKTWIIIAIVVLVIIAIVIYIRSKNAAELAASSANKSLEANLNSSSTRAVFPLVYGSKGEEVKTLQRYLKSKGANIGNSGPGLDGVDGIWGPLTDAAIKSIIKKDSITQADLTSLA